MRNRKQKDVYFTSSAPQPSRPTLIDEARALYTRYVNQAVQDINQSHSANDRAKPLWLKAINVIGVVAVALTVGLLIYGIFTWTDAPIRQTPTGYVGKTGIAHAREEYERFKQWEKSLLVVAPFAFIVNIIAAVIADRRRRH
ncbi:MAG TPA: hypothetical protein VNI02_23825 [Blastocatellia bacterium]|jgi:hypothetical protein|nr:hypothetical protein [Blastocatellia bacterium]